MGYLQGQIIYLDSSRNRFDAMALNGSAFFSDVEYLDTGMTPRGETDHPEIGDMVVLRSMEDGRYELEKYYHQRAYDENGLPAQKIRALMPDKTYPRPFRVTGRGAAQTAHFYLYYAE